MIQERTYRPVSGWLPLVLSAALLVGGPWYTVLSLKALSMGTGSGWAVVTGVLLLLCGIVSLAGYMAIAPNQARVLLLFGHYKGSALESGFYWVNPFFTKKKISLRIRNFETGSINTPERKDAAGKVVQERSRTLGRPSKVNDRDGNPIEISAVVVWRVVNTAEALFEVDDFEDFVAVQSEAALRNMATRHPYDSEEHEVSLRGSTAAARHPGAARQGRRRGPRGAHQPPCLRPGNRRCDASAPAGPGGRGGTNQDRRGRGGNGADGP
jgi:hypothetical protein